MTDALDHIFSAIMKSEMIAQVGKQRHKEVKDGIEQLKVRLKKQESQKAEHVAKKSKLEIAVADAIIAVKISKAKEEQLSNELHVMNENVKLQKSRYIDVNKNMVDGYEKFIRSVKTFTSDYSLSSSGTERRIQSAEKKLRALETNKDKLILNVEAIEDLNDGLQRVFDDKSKGKMSLMEINGKIDETNKEIENELSCSNELETKISLLVTEPDNGSEFRRVKEELGGYDVTELQSDIDTLQKDLKTLTRKLRKKEAQSLRMQYRHWQRQQTKKSVDSLNLNNESQPKKAQKLQAHSSNPDIFEQEEMMSLPDEPIKVEEN